MFIWGRCPSFAPAFTCFVSGWRTACLLLCVLSHMITQLYDQCFDVTNCFHGGVGWRLSHYIVYGNHDTHTIIISPTYICLDNPPVYNTLGSPPADRGKYRAMKVNKWSIKLLYIRGLQSFEPHVIMSFALLMRKHFLQESGRRKKTAHEL